MDVGGGVGGGDEEGEEWEVEGVEGMMVKKRAGVGGGRTSSG